MTDARIDEALKRAAELVQRLVPGRGAHEYLEGWTEAIWALDYVRCTCLESKQEVERIGHNYDCPATDAQDAIAKFITAMLGKARRPQTIEEIATTAFVEDDE